MPSNVKNYIGLTRPSQRTRHFCQSFCTLPRFLDPLGYILSNNKKRRNCASIIIQIINFFKRRQRSQETLYHFNKNDNFVNLVLRIFALIAAKLRFVRRITDGHDNIHQ